MLCIQVLPSRIKTRSVGQIGIEQTRFEACILKN